MVSCAGSWERGLLPYSALLGWDPLDGAGSKGIWQEWTLSWLPALAMQGRPVFSFSTLSPHTGDVQKDGRVSLTVLAEGFKVGS